MRPTQLDHNAWLASLAKPGMRLEASLAGHPLGRVRLTRAWDTGERTIEMHLLFAFRRGHLVADINGTQHHLAAGDICLVPPWTRFRFQGSAQSMVARFRFRAVLDGGEFAWGSDARIATMDGTLERLVDLLIDELHHDEGSLLVVDLTRAFCRSLARAGSRHPYGASGRSGVTGDQLAELAAMVARQPYTTSPRDLATVLGVSHDWATRLIRAATGLPPCAWIVRQRLRAAVDLLAHGLSPMETSQRLGHPDPRSFGRQFNAAYDCPPGVWQQRNHRGNGGTDPS